MNYEQLQLKNQLCFPLYACSKEIIKQYKPFLDEINLTYTQYITMMVMWDNNTISVKELGKHLYLDSGTLTPLLKRLEEKNYIIRKRSSEDERFVFLKITEEGLRLRDKAINIKKEISNCIDLSEEEMLVLYKLLYKVLNNFEGNEE